MALLLLDYLKYNLGMKVPNVFFYTSTRMCLGLLTALLLSIFLGPRLIKKLYELKIGQTIRTSECPLLGSLHRNKQNTPTMGGVLIIGAMIVSLLLWMDFTSIFTWILLTITLGLGLVGGLDDYLKLKHRNTKGLSSKQKLILQAGLSTMVALYFVAPSVQQMLSIDPPQIKEERVVGGKTTFVDNVIKKTKERVVKDVPLTDYFSRIYVPFLKDPLFHLGALFTLIWAFLVIMGSSNAVNLTDGLDGLASGCIVMVAATFGLIAFLSNNADLSSYLNILYIEGSGEIAIYLFSAIGATLGFLWYNGHPAQIFMGDVGSLTLGGIIGVSALLLKKEILLAIVGGVFVVEALSVILQVASFRLRGERIFLCAPIHHHFEFKGWPETKVVIRFWIVGLFLALIGIASLKFQ
jgi:phospho-N-acetylmuramoyl-pentapeptide-transferase